MASLPEGMPAGRVAETATLLILAAGVSLGFAAAGLPALPHGVEPRATGVFSAARAMEQLQVIAATPHPVGTVAHDRVRDYLVDRLRALGCGDVHVQSATGFNTLAGPIAATIANVVCRERGTRPGNALLLTAHYDAVPRAPGAGDDGAGVATILETLRDLAGSPPLANDLIVVLSDAEEEGLLGAEAFVDLHPWARDVRLVLNFDNRGDAGPVFMFQTSPGNARLIEALAANVGDARANSLTGEIYRHLPSDTDLSIWLHSRFSVAALNFADVGGYTRYHTPMDDARSLDPRVLQHSGEYALGLTRAFGNQDLAAAHAHDDVYFNAPLIGLIHYSESFAVPLGALGVLLAIVLLAVGARSGGLSWRGVGRGFLVLAGALFLPAIGALAAWRIVTALHPGYAEILQGDPYNSTWYLLSCAGFTVAVVTGLQRQAARRTSWFELSVAPIAVWALLGVIIAFALPGASYLFIWPLVGAVAGAALLMRTHRPSRELLVSGVVALLAVPTLALWPSLVRSLEVALTASLLPFCAALMGLMLSLLVVPLARVGALGRGVTLAALATGIGALVVAEATSGFTAARKRPDSLVYLVDADSSQAWWASFDAGTDEWTSLAIGRHPARAGFDRFHVARPGRSWLAAGAVAGTRPLAPDLVSDPVSGGRQIRLHIPRSGPGESMALFVEGSAVATDLTINGRALRNGDQDRYSAAYHQGDDGAVIRYFGVPDDGVDLQFTLRTATPVSLRLVRSIDGLPALATGPLPPRPARLMSKPFIPTDATIYEQTLKPWQ